MSDSTPHREPPRIVATYVAELQRSLQRTYPKLPARFASPALIWHAREASVAAWVVEQLLRDAAGWVGDQALGLTLGASEGVALCPALSAMSEQPTLRAALSTLQARESVLGGVQYDLSERGRFATLDCRLQLKEPLLVRFHAEYVFTRVLGLFRKLSPRGPARAHRVLLQFAPPRPRARHAATFGCPVLFGQRANTMTFPRAWLDRPDVSALDDPQELESCVALPSSRARLLSEPVRALIRNQGQLVEIESERVAEILNVTPRVLRRRLAVEGTSLTDLLDERRQQLACEQLLVGASHETLLASTGFASVSTFGRAFKRWTGLTPNEFVRRRRILPRPPAAAFELDERALGPARC